MASFALTHASSSSSGVRGRFRGESPSGSGTSDPKRCLEEDAMDMMVWRIRLDQGRIQDPTCHVCRTLCRRRFAWVLRRGSTAT